MRKLQNVEVKGVNTGDYPDFCDAYISYAEWEDTGMELSEEEYFEINEDRSLVYDYIIDSIF